MCCLRPAVVVLAAAVIASCGGPASTGSPGRGGSYYLSLGDSLARGVQPDRAGASIVTRHGYPDQLAAALRRRDPGLRLVKLGCSGETTGTMISGRHCAYPAGSQLAAAVRFLRAQAGRVALITIDIAANDPGSCFTLPAGGGDPPCAGGPAPSTIANLARILAALRAAAGPKVTIIGMSYYDPELAGWRYGRARRALARRSERFALAYDGTLARVYASAGARMADVAGAFHSADFASLVTVPHLGTMPSNVAAVCQWTWDCAPPPRGPNKHPNTAGYRQIARAFLAAARQAAARG